jgi:DNA polymerase elongation subunit (family B)
MLTTKKIIANIEEGKHTTINFADLHLLPTREYFVNAAARKQNDLLLRNGDKLLFLPITIQSKDSYNENTPPHLQLDGILTDGRKCRVKLPVGKLVYCDILIPQLESMPNGLHIPAPISPIEFEKTWKSIEDKYFPSYTSKSTVKMYPSHGFTVEPLAWTRFTFTSWKEREQFVKLIASVNADRLAEEEPRVLTSHDYTKPVHLCCRDIGFKTADWNWISSYKVLDKTNTFVSLELSDSQSITRLKNRERKQLSPDVFGLVDKDRSIVSTFDIETYKSIKDGQVPKPGDKNYNIFNACVTFHHPWSNHILMDLCAICLPCADGPVTARTDTCAGEHGHTLITVKCRNESEVMRAIHAGWAAMRPDYLMAYNGSNFDWPLWLDKCQYYELMSELYGSLVCNPANWWLENVDAISGRWYKRSVKIDAETNMECAKVGSLPGVQDIDMMPLCKKLYSREEVGMKASLNFYLGLEKLKSKQDMPYEEMFAIYESACAERGIDPITHEAIVPGKIKNLTATTQRAIEEIVYYCRIDALRTQNIQVARVFIQDAREMANLSFTTIDDALWRANGVKVRNLLGYIANKLNTAFSDTTRSVSAEDKEEYPGGLVFDTIAGRYVEKPIVALDFGSLYPNLALAHNFTSDKIVRTQKDADTLSALGYKLIPIEFDSKKGTVDNVATGWSVYHNEITKGETAAVDHYMKEVTLTLTTKLGVSAESTHKFMINPADLISPLTEEWPEAAVGVITSAGWSAAPQQHEYLITNGYIKRSSRYVPIRTRPALKNERMGILTYAINKIIGLRKPVKNAVEHLKKCIEKMQRESLTQMEVCVGDQTYTVSPSELALLLAKYNAKSNALKVYFNTFYGESGNQLSSTFNLMVCGGITSYGQKNLRRVINHLKSRGCTICAGDTDSVYSIMEPTLYEEKTITTPQGDRVIPACIGDADEMVTRTIGRIHYLAEEVTDLMIKCQQSVRLVMSYEEVGFPTLLLGRKKYALHPHVGQVNWKAKPMIRGIDIVKQGKSSLCKELGMNIIKAALNPADKRPIEEMMVEQLMRLVPNSPNEIPWKISDWSTTYTYRPGKKNPTVLKFVDRMSKLYASMLQIAEAEPDKVQKNKLFKQAAAFAPPEPGDKFVCIATTKDQVYDLYGRMVKSTKGDILEYTHAVTRESVNVREYVQGTLAGLFARFIAWRDEFAPTEDELEKLKAKHEDLETGLGAKAVDKIRIKHAKKEVMDIWNKNTGFIASSARNEGARRRKVWKEVTEVVKVATGVNDFTIEEDREVTDMIEDLNIMPPVPQWIYSDADAFLKHKIQEYGGRKGYTNLVRDSGIGEMIAKSAISRGHVPSGWLSKIIKEASTEVSKIKHTLCKMIPRYVEINVRMQNVAYEVIESNNPTADDFAKVLTDDDKSFLKQYSSLRQSLDNSKLTYAKYARVADLITSKMGEVGEIKVKIVDTKDVTAEHRY